MFAKSFNQDTNLVSPTGVVDASGSTGGLALASGTTAQRPTSPAVGMSRWNTTISAAEIWDGAAWSTYFGTQATTASIFTETLPTIEYLVVAGGGSGGDHRNSGGGAGGLVYHGANSTTKTPNGSAKAFVRGTSYTVTVAGVAGADASGSNSSIVGGAINIVATGGGAHGVAGGSGGAGAAGTAGQGFAGGTPGIGGNNSAMGAGGGAGGVGNNASGNAGGAGGVGLQYSEFPVLTGTNAGYPTGTLTAGWFAGGGGGGGLLNGAGSGGAGGIGGGGAGGYGPYGAAYGASGSWGNPGAVNSGGGGGGGSDLHNANGNAAAGFGASGIVIIAYRSPVALATGGTINTTARTGWYLHIFTGSGTFTTV